MSEMHWVEETEPSLAFCGSPFTGLTDRPVSAYIFSSDWILRSVFTRDLRPRPRSSLP